MKLDKITVLNYQILALEDTHSIIGLKRKEHFEAFFKTDLFNVPYKIIPPSNGERVLWIDLQIRIIWLNFLKQNLIPPNLIKNMKYFKNFKDSRSIFIYFLAS